MNNKASALIGFLLGFALAAFLTGEFHATIVEAKAAIAQCEAELPRNQKCVVTAEVAK